MPVLLPDNVTPKKYVLDLDVDLERFRLMGSVSILCDVSARTRTVKLHSRELCIYSASYEPDEVPASPDRSKAIRNATNVTYELADSDTPFVATITFDGDELPVGAGKLFLKFSGEVNTDMAGFSRSTYRSADGKDQVMASTQFEAIDARRCFPCWDEPALKATFECTLTVKQSFSVLSNMPELSNTLLVDGRRRVHFAETPRMSTYLLAFVVGEFDCLQQFTANKVAVRVFTPPGKAQLGRFALDVAVRTLEYYDDFFGVPYPLPKLDMVAIPEFAAGAMENWGLVTYREVDLMLDESTAASWQKQRVCTTVTHELAHQWFGNLVTMKWWDNLWLNEGFASWIELFACDHLFPEWRVWDQFTTDEMAIAQKKDALRSSHPVQVPIHHAEEVDEVFDTISYCKGACVVRMLYGVLGEDNFRAGLQKYFRDFAYKNSVTEDLWNCWTEESGIDVEALMGMWTTCMGFPVVTVTTSEEVSRWELEQCWFLGDGNDLSPEEQSIIWTIPLTRYSLPQRKGDDYSSSVEFFKQKTMTIEMGGKTGAQCLLNAGQGAMFRVNYGAAVLAKITPAMYQPEGLPNIDHAALLNDAYALSVAKRVQVEDVIHLVAHTVAGQNARSEQSISTAAPSYIVWKSVATVLEAFGRAMDSVSNEAARAAFQPFALQTARTCMVWCGWDARETDGHLDNLLRGVTIKTLLNFDEGDAVLKAQVATRIEKFVAGDSSALQRDLLQAAMAYYVRTGGVEEFECLMRFWTLCEDSADRKAVMQAIGFAPTPALKNRVLRWALDGVKLQDISYPIDSVGRSGLLGRQLAWTFFQDSFQIILDAVGQSSASIMDGVILGCCRHFADSDSATALEEYFKPLVARGGALRSNQRTVTQMIEQVRTAAQFVDSVNASSLSTAEGWTKVVDIINNGGAPSKGVPEPV
eukprot:INCI6130.1.p1 GENE.INCI6130.1~~INCI6130.1.p1  ORF type:complete len:924 (-),score=171.94 INCI6130.1:120-2891(-)